MVNRPSSYHTCLGSYSVHPLSVARGVASLLRFDVNVCVCVCVTETGTGRGCSQLSIGVLLMKKEGAD